MHDTVDEKLKIESLDHSTKTFQSRIYYSVLLPLFFVLKSKTYKSNMVQKMKIYQALKGEDLHRINV